MDRLPQDHASPLDFVLGFLTALALVTVILLLMIW